MVLEPCVVCGDPREDTSFSKLCESCQAKSEQQKEKFKNFDLIHRKDYVKYKSLMSEKNMHKLFSFESGCGPDKYNIYSIYINTVTGIPYLHSTHMSALEIRPGTVSVYESDPISFYRLLEWAKVESDEIFEKYKGISEENWIDYIINDI